MTKFYEVTKEELELQGIDFIVENKNREMKSSDIDIKYLSKDRYIIVRNKYSLGLGLYDTKDKCPLLPMEFQNIEIEDNVATCIIPKYEGVKYINLENGETIYENTCTTINDFIDGLCIVEVKPGEFNVINKKGNMLIEQNLKKIKIHRDKVIGLTLEDNKYVICTKFNNDKLILLNTLEGIDYIHLPYYQPIEGQDIDIYSRYILYTNKDNGQGIIDIDTGIDMEVPPNDTLSLNDNGAIIVRYEGKSKLYNIYSDIVSDVEYDSISRFVYGIAIAKRDGIIVRLDLQGNEYEEGVVIPFNVPENKSYDIYIKSRYRIIRRFISEGKICLGDHVYNIIDIRTGKVLTEDYTYNHITHLNRGEFELTPIANRDRRVRLFVEGNIVSPLSATRKYSARLIDNPPTRFGEMSDIEVYM